MGRFKGCGIIVLNSEGKILLGQRAKAKTETDHMQFCIPGGSVDPGEEYHEAAIRELYEEVGLTVDVRNFSLLCEVLLEIESGSRVDNTYIYHIDDEVPVANEEEMLNLEFYGLEDILGMALHGKLYPATLVSISNYINKIAK